MTPILLVPLDGSPTSEHALPAALTIARRTGALVRLAFVQITPPVNTAAATYLDDLVHRLALLPDAPRLEVRLLSDTEPHPRHDSPGVVASPRRQVAHALAAAARDPGVELVVMTTHGRSGLSRFWLGSVTEHLVHHAPEPILLIRPPAGPPDLTQTPSFQHILVPLDGSTVAEQMLERAVAFGRPFGAHYTLLNLIDRTGLEEAMALSAMVIDQHELDAENERASQYLVQLAEPLRARGLVVVTEVRFGGPVAVVLLDYAHAQHVDLIALKTHGRSGLARLVMGSTADKIVRGADMPILLHQPHG